MQYKRQVKEEGWTEDHDSQHFIFKDDCITLEIPGDPPVIVDDWEIIPHSTPLEVYCVQLTYKSFIIIQNNRLTKLQLINMN